MKELPKFIETKEKFLNTFKSLSWDDYFAELFPLKSSDQKEW